MTKYEHEENVNDLARIEGVSHWCTEHLEEEEKWDNTLVKDVVVIRAQLIAEAWGLA
jgi:hypothetical protein